MKKILFIVAAFVTTFASAQIKMPQASTTQKINQDFGMGAIELTYSRPNIKGRSVLKEKSELAPLGSMWRLGANAATKIKFTDKVTIGGTELEAGTYVIYAIPGKDMWDVIFNKGVNNWGTDGYKEAEDVVHVKVKAEKAANFAESFTMQIINVAAETCELHMTWGNVQVAVPISTNIKDRVRAQIEKALAADNIQANTYNTAANFYYEFDKDYTKAIVNITKAVEASKDAYWMVLLKARIEKALGDKVSAKASAQKCIEMATGKNDADYVTFANELIKSL
jgi:tetratricopeptide (TPR) repeat protein